MFIYDNDYFYRSILRCTKDTVSTVLGEKEKYYTKYNIPKLGGERTIYAINSKSELFILQQNLKNNFLDKIELPIPVKGFVKKENFITYLSEHIKRKFYLRLDIRAFFDNISTKQIKHEIKNFVQEEEIVEQIIDIVTLNDRLPQGAVTSPVISNIIFRRIDQRILKYSQTMDVYYTRYADDLLFSSNSIDFHNDKYFCSMIDHILKSAGFQSNHNKKKTSNTMICLSGFVVDNGIHLSRKKLKDINIILYYFRKDKGFTHKKYSVDKALFQDENWIENLNKFMITSNINRLQFENSNSLINYLCGYRAFLISLLKHNDTIHKQYSVVLNKIKNIEKIVNAIVSIYK